MAEEVKNEEVVDNNALVDQVKALKENSVSKSDYEKLQSDYNHLFGEYIKSRPSQKEKLLFRKTVLLLLQTSTCPTSKKRSSILESETID